MLLECFHINLPQHTVQRGCTGYDLSFRLQHLKNLVGMMKCPLGDAVYTGLSA